MAAMDVSESVRKIKEKKLGEQNQKERNKAEKQELVETFL